MELKVVYTAIFGNHDDLKAPTIITPGWRYICFTDQDVKSNTWEIKKVSPITSNNRLTARYYKILFFRHIQETYSMWIDGSFRITCDLNHWWNTNFKEDITCIKHPNRDCVYDEASVCITQNKDDVDKIRKQILFFNNHNFSKNHGLIQSGILMRKKCNEINMLCDEWYSHILNFSYRDQLSFQYVFRNYKVNLIKDFVYQNNKYFIFTKHNS